MSDRITKRMAQVAFERMIAALGLPVSTQWRESGWKLESAGFGRWEMGERNAENGGISTRVTSRLYTNREVYDHCFFTIRWLEEALGQSVVFDRLQPIIKSQEERGLLK